MLATTVLKVRHEHEHEAKKLLPYIKECDVFAIENAFVTEGQAQEVEKVWEDLLGSGISLPRF